MNFPSTASFTETVLMNSGNFLITKARRPCSVLIFLTLPEPAAAMAARPPWDPGHRALMPPFLCLELCLATHPPRLHVVNSFCSTGQGRLWEPAPHLPWAGWALVFPQQARSTRQLPLLYIHRAVVSRMGACGPRTCLCCPAAVSHKTRRHAGFARFVCHLSH